MQAAKRSKGYEHQLLRFFQPLGHLLILLSGRVVAQIPMGLRSSPIQVRDGWIAAYCQIVVAHRVLSIAEHLVRETALIVCIAARLEADGPVEIREGFRKIAARPPQHPAPRMRLLDR